MPLLLSVSIGFGIALRGMPAEILPLSAGSSLLMEAGTGVIVAAREPDTLRYPASTTKIMTSILLVEDCAMSDMVEAPKGISKVKESSAHLKDGERMSVRQLLYAILLRSANDACVAGAVHHSGSVAAFVEKMNQKAKLLGCTHTHFVNPNGLPDDEHFTTAHDLAIMGRYAMGLPAFREIVGTAKHELVRSINQKDTLLESRNKLLGKLPYIDGIKTGWTKAAGHCFVGSGQSGGLRLISVVLKSDSWETDTQTLMEWGFQNIQMQDLDTAVKEKVPGTEVEADLVSDARLTYPMTPGKTFTRTVVWRRGVALPIAAGTLVADLTVDDGQGWVKAVPLKAVREVRSPFPQMAGVWGIAGALFLCGAYAMMRQRRNLIYANLASEARDSAPS